jgi:hypothetical protein
MVSGITPRANFQVLTFDDKGRGTARDNVGFGEYTFRHKPGTIDAGNTISGEINSTNPLIIEDIIIETGRCAMTERREFLSKGDGITSEKEFGKANEEKPSDETRNPNKDIRRKPE